MKSQRYEILNKFDGRCAYCGCCLHDGRISQPFIKKMQVDHVIPKTQFEHRILNNFWIPDFLSHLGVNDVEHIDNKFPACQTCNNYKDTYSMDEFRNQLSLQVERAEKTSFNFRMAIKYDQVKITLSKIKFHYENYIK